MSALLDHPRLDALVLHVLPQLKLGSYGEDDDIPVIVDANLGAAMEAYTDDVTELGAAMQRGGPIDPRLLQRIRIRSNRFAPMAQNTAIAKSLGPLTRLLPAISNVASAATNTALTLRTRDQYAKLSRPNNQTTVHTLNLADAAISPTYTVKAPVNGRPFRLLGMTQEVSTVGSGTVPPTRNVVGVGFSSFVFGGVERVSTSNVTLSTGSAAAAKWDASGFSKLNQDDDNSTKLFPWGIGPTGFFESDFTFSFAVANNCGLAVNIATTYYFQASPCDDETNGRGIYRERSIPMQDERTAKYMASVLAFNTHPQR